MCVHVYTTRIVFIQHGSSHFATLWPLAWSNLPPPPPLWRPQFHNQSHWSVFLSSPSLTPAEIWQSFRHHARTAPGQREYVFRDTEAQAVVDRSRAEKIWVRSAAANSAVFTVAAHREMTPAAFVERLPTICPEAVGLIPSPHSPSCAIVSFDSEEARDKACTESLTINGLLFIGNPHVGH